MRFATLVLLVTAGLASAQFPQPIPPSQMQPPQLRPTISPYLSLLNRTRPAYQNVFGGGGLLQQQQMYDSLNNLQTQVAGLQNTPQSTYPGTGSELSTGKVPGFFTHTPYFLNRGGVGLQRGLTGQYGTTGANSVYSNQPGSPLAYPPASNSIMPYRR